MIASWRLESVDDLWLAWIVGASWQLCLFIALVALASWLARPLSAKVRYGLWLLVLVKVFLPPALSAPWSVANFVIWSSVAEEVASETHVAFPQAAINGAAASFYSENALSSSWPNALAVIWAAGCLAFWAAVAWRYRRLVSALSKEPIDEGPVRIALEKAALQLKLKAEPELLQTSQFSSPFLFGLWRPRIVVPRPLLDQLSPQELDAVLLHELMHWRRRDTWIGMLQVVALGLFWFHPAVWWASVQLRHARESACDEDVLRLNQLSPKSYGEALVRILTASRGRSLATGSLVGVFERGAQLQQRLEGIMNFEPQKQWRRGMSIAAVAAFAALFLPMSASVAEPPTAQAEKPDAPATSYPQIVSTTPASGATDVDPELAAITVTFDRPMSEGMSWTGGGPEFPPIDKSRKAHWKDDRTCVLPVTLKKGAYYRVGINSKSYRNFRSAEGTPTPPEVIRFTTQGADESLTRKVRVPQIVKVEPANGASDVDPSTAELRVTFDLPMGEGMSWTGGGSSFPTIPNGKSAHWTDDGRTCVLPVNLKPDASYQLGLNSLSHNNFQSKWGVPLAPVVYQFQTKAAP